MKSIAERVNPTRVNLKVVISEEQLKPSFDKAYREIAKQVNIPGFRRGKVPSQIIDQRFGRGVVLEQAINDVLGTVYPQAVQEQKLAPVSQPVTEVISAPDMDTFKGDLEVSFDLHVYPEVEMPDLSVKQIEVDDIEVTQELISAELDNLRARFGKIIPVERPAKTGDFVYVDLVARIGGQEIDRAAGVSCQLGENSLLECLDDALLSLTAGEEAIFKTTLAGGAHMGKEAEVTATLRSVNERELPEADDEFAQLASEFDTIAELNNSLAERLEKVLLFQRSVDARDKLLETLLDELEIALPEPIEQQINVLEDEQAKAEQLKEIRRQILLDSLVRSQGITLADEELHRYIAHAAQERGMDVGTFFAAVQRSGQVERMVTDIARNKALAIALDKVKVVDSSGKELDISEFTIREDKDPKVRGEENESAV